MQDLCRDGLATFDVPTSTPPSRTATPDLNRRVEVNDEFWVYSPHPRNLCFVKAIERRFVDNGGILIVICEVLRRHDVNDMRETKGLPYLRLVVRDELFFDEGTFFYSFAEGTYSDFHDGCEHLSTVSTSLTYLREYHDFEWVHVISPISYLAVAAGM